MIGLQIVQHRLTYFKIELNGEPVTKETYTYAQVEVMYDLYSKIYQSGWNDALNEVNEDM